ncbi:hypothetical protein GBAR_LOCUS16975, partial [Geodia barretti]
NHEDTRVCRLTYTKLFVFQCIYFSTKFHGLIYELWVSILEKKIMMMNKTPYHIPIYL